MSVWSLWRQGCWCTWWPVSILVLLDVGLKPRRKLQAHRQRQPVSILVLMDVGLKQRSSMTAKQTENRFQSLFWWMSVWSNFKFDRCKIRKVIVSILVLMDVGLKHRIWRIRIQETWKVSILVLMDVGLKPGIAQPEAKKQWVSILVLMDVGLKPTHAWVDIG